MPTAHYFMHQWLQNYQYRTLLSWWIFAAAGMGALVITLLTVSFQAIKAALANPVKSLRTEQARKMGIYSGNECNDDAKFTMVAKGSKEY